MAGYPRPSESDMNSRNNLNQSIINGQSVAIARRTTSSLSGVPQQQVSARGMADILQGTMAVRGPQDSLLVVNKALSGHLDQLYQGGISDISTFSSVEREFVPGMNGTSGGSGGGASGSGEYAPNGEGFNYVPGYVGPDTFPPGGKLQPWGLTNFGSSVAIPGEQVASFAYWAGFRGDALVTIVAISERESHWAPWIIARGPKDDSYGLMMINMIGNLGPDRRAKNNLASNRDLLDPQINMNAAFTIYTEANQTFKPWSIKGDPFAKTNMPLAREVVARAEQLGYFKYKPGTAPAISQGGGAGMGGISGAGGANSIEDIVYAHKLIGNHPNMWMVRDSKAAAALFLDGGTTGNDLSEALIWNGRKALLFPSLLNYLYFLLENNFLIGGYLGSIGKKHKKGNPALPLSNHSWGGAIDIGSVGIAGEGKLYNVGTPDSRRVGDKMFNLLATLPKDQWADEHGWHWVVQYGTNGFHTYSDSGHHHFGFNSGRQGSLMTALRPRAPQSGIRNAV